MQGVRRMNSRAESERLPDRGFGFQHGYCWSTYGRTGSARVAKDSGVARPGNVLRASTLEIIPLKNVRSQFEFLEPGQRVSVTASPSRGQTATIDLAVDLARLGFEVVPHLSARLIRDETHVGQIVRRLHDAGITGAFVVGGDGEPIGAFQNGLALLTALRSLEHGPTEIGIPGYPEGQPQIPKSRLVASLSEKQALADYVTTQMCFDAERTIAWISDIRANGVRLPVHIGIPGATSVSRLVSVSAKIGVGASLRFLSKHTGVTSLVRRGSYSPDRLVGELLPAVEGPLNDVRGFHIFTFNQVDATERWRHGYLSDNRAQDDSVGEDVEL